MQETKVTTLLAVPADRVWEVIGAVDGVDKWSPVINTCRIETSPEGGFQRFCSADNGELVEKVLLLDNEKRILKYAITEQPFLPITDMVSTLKITGDEEEATITTTSTYSVNEGANADEIKAMIEHIYSSSYTGIEQLVAKKTA